MLDERIYGRKRKPVTLDGNTGKVLPFPARPLKKKAAQKESALGGGASGSWDGPVPTGYVYDPIFGLPIPDPSGVLENSGYATQPADAALAIGNDVTDAVKSAADFVFKGFKYIVYGVAIVGAVVVLAEGTKLSRDAFGRRARA